MNYTSKGIIDVACCGARKSAEEAKQLIEDLAKCNYRAPSETPGSSSRLKGIGVIELNRMIAIENKVGIVHENEKRNSAEEGLTHEGPYQVEEAQYLNVNRSYNIKPNLNLPTHYRPTLRNHDNFSYGGGAQGQRPGQNFKQHYAPPGFQKQQQ